MTRSSKKETCKRIAVPKPVPQKLVAVRAHAGLRRAVVKLVAQVLVQLRGAVRKPVVPAHAEGRCAERKPVPLGYAVCKPMA